MNILLLTPNFYPEKTGIGVSATDSARFIRDLGHEVRVLTSVPYYPEWEIPEEYSKRFVYNEDVEGIHVSRLLRYVPKYPTSIKRVFHELSFALHALSRALFIKTDCIICISPPLLLGFFAVFISWLKRKPLWFYVQDIQPDAAIRLGMLKNKPLLYALKFIEKFIYRFSTKVLVLCEEMADNISEKGVPSEKLEVVPLAVDTKEFKDYRNRDPKTSEFRKKHNLKEKFLVVYSGNLGVKQEPQILVETAELLNEQKDVFIALVGDGAQRESVRELISQKKLKNVELYPLVERADFADLLSSADILVCTMREEVSSFSVPSKVYSYLAAQKPVIVSAAKESAAAGLIIKNDLGYLIEPGSASAIAQCIKAIKLNIAEARVKALAGSQHIDENYSYEQLQSGVYNSLLDSLNS